MITARPLYASLGLLLAVLLTGTSKANAAHNHPSLSGLGYDVSYVQCGSKLPVSQAFGIVGVNDGRANNFNPCLATELTWAGTSNGATSQPKTAVYLNTGNPGDVTPTVADWPTSSNPIVDPYGLCMGTNDAACSWEYGYLRTEADLATIPPTSYLVWLDVETANSWSANKSANRADLEGMVYALSVAGETVGIYSTSTQWSTIAGTVPATSRLFNLPEWRPGAATPSQARSFCQLSPLTRGGRVAMTQYTPSSLDYDVSCQ